MEMFPVFLEVYLLTVAFLIYSWGLGGGLLAKFNQRMAWSQLALASQGYMPLFMATTLGISLVLGVLFLLGIAQQITLLNALLSFGVLAVIVAVSNRRQGTASLRATQVPATGFLLLAALLALCVLTAIKAPGMWDDTMYQLPAARWYAQQHGLVVHEYLRFPLFPQNMNLLFMLGIIFNGEILAQVFATLPLFLIAVGLMALSVQLTRSILVGALAAVSLCFLAPIRETLGYAYVDNGLALFCWAALLAVFQWDYGRERSSDNVAWLVLAGIFAGIATGVKLFGLVFGVIAGTYIFLRSRKIKPVAIFLCALVVAGSWWYLRSYFVSGDPLHPAGGGFFGHFLWDAADLAGQKAEQATHGIDPRSLDFWGALHKAGLSFWVCALLGLLLLRTMRPVRALQYVVVVYLLFWFFVTQVNRYVAPVYGAAAFLSCYMVFHVWKRVATHIPFGLPPRAKQGVLGLALLAGLAYALQVQYRSADTALANWGKTLESRDGYELFRTADKGIVRYGDRLLQIGFENAIYFFDGVVIGDWFGLGRYRDLTTCQNQPCGPLPATQLLEAMKKFGAGQVIVSTMRYPQFDPVRYEPLFDVLQKNHQGVLLVPKNAP